MEHICGALMGHPEEGSIYTGPSVELSSAENG